MEASSWAASWTVSIVQWLMEGVRVGVGDGAIIALWPVVHIVLVAIVAGDDGALDPHADVQVGGDVDGEWCGDGCVVGVGCDEGGRAVAVAGMRRGRGRRCEGGVRIRCVRAGWWGGEELRVVAVVDVVVRASVVHDDGSVEGEGEAESEGARVAWGVGGRRRVQAGVVCMGGAGRQCHWVVRCVVRVCDLVVGSMGGGAAEHGVGAGVMEEALYMRVCVCECACVWCVCEDEELVCVCGALMVVVDDDGTKSSEVNVEVVRVWCGVVWGGRVCEVVRQAVERVALRACVVHDDGSVHVERHVNVKACVEHVWCWVTRRGGGRLLD